MGALGILVGILWSLVGYSTVTSGISGNTFVVLWKPILRYSEVTLRVSGGHYEGIPKGQDGGYWANLKVPFRLLIYA